MYNELKNDLYQYFSSKTNLTEAEQLLLDRLKEELPYFVISRIHRDDLRGHGFDVTNVSDHDMSQLARKMGDDYCNQLFCSSMDIIAEDSVKIPRMFCTQCAGTNIEAGLEGYICKDCDNKWVSDDFTRTFEEVKNMLDTIDELEGFESVCEFVSHFYGLTALRKYFLSKAWLAQNDEFDYLQDKEFRKKVKELYKTIKSIDEGQWKQLRSLIKELE